MLSIGKLAKGQEGYYLDAVARGVEDYYLEGEAPGRWLGAGTALLGLSGRRRRRLPVGSPQPRRGRATE